MKTAEMKIQFYTEGKREFCRVLIFDTRRRIWRHLQGIDVDMAALTLHADNVREKFERGGFDNAKK